MAENGTQEAAIEHAESVKIDDFIKEDETSNVLNLFIPTFGFTNYGNNLFFQSLPDILPESNRYLFFSQRDMVGLMTPKYDPLWASVIGTAVTKGAAWGWEIASSVPLRRKRAYELLQYATVGSLVGWVKFVSAHLRSFLLTGKAIVEIERDNLGRVTALHHLNPLRCLLTDSPEIPVLYYDRRGQIHELRYHEVMVMVDQVDPTEGEIGTVEGAVERAYTNVKIMSAMYRYFYEKITGKRALSLEFIQGLSPKSLEDAMQVSEHEQERKGAWVYKGVVTIPIPQTDTPIQRVSIPLAEVPDGFDFQEMRDDAVIIYAVSTGQDLNDIDPRLATAKNLGTGAQSIVLAEKASGKGLAAWREQFTADFHNIVLPDTQTTFTFIEDDLRDRQQEAQVTSSNVNAWSAMIDKLIITPAEARNLAVDAKILPREFIDEDITAGDSVASDEPSNSGEKEDDSQPGPMAEEDEVTKKAKDLLSAMILKSVHKEKEVNRVDDLISMEYMSAVELVNRLKKGESNG